MRFILITLCLLVLTPIVFPVSVSLAANNSAEPREVYIEDALNRKVVLKRVPERVVSLAPSITEMLFYLDLQRYVVGVDSISYSDPYLNISSYVKEHEVTDVGGYWWSAIEVEKILELDPELVLADKGGHTPLLEVFERYNITVIYLNGGSARSLADIYFDLGILATIYGLSERASEFMDLVDNAFAQYRDLLKPYEGLKVLVVVGVYNGIWVAGRATFIDDVLSRLGLVNVANSAGWYAVDLEKISELNPDIVIATQMAGSREETINALHDTGIYDLGVPVIVLSQEASDSLQRPGPLIQYAPSHIYNAITSTLQTQITLEHGQGTESPITELSLIAVAFIAVFVIGVFIGFVIRGRKL